MVRDAKGGYDLELLRLEIGPGCLEGDWKVEQWVVGWDLLTGNG